MKYAGQAPAEMLTLSNIPCNRQASHLLQFFWGGGGGGMGGDDGVRIQLP